MHSSRTTYQCCERSPRVIKADTMTTYNTSQQSSCKSAVCMSIKNNSVSQPLLLWQAAYDLGIEGDRPGSWSSSCGPIDAPERHSFIRTRKHKVATDTKHKFNFALNLLDRNFTENRYATILYLLWI